MTLAEALKAWTNDLRTALPRICPACQTWAVPETKETPSPNLRGLAFRIGGADMAGETIPLCPSCQMKALLGRKPFRRRENVVILL